MKKKIMLIALLTSLFFGSVLAVVPARVSAEFDCSKDSPLPPHTYCPE